MTLPSFNPMPTVGPSIYTVRGFVGASVANGSSLGPPGSNAAVLDPLCAFQFPRDIFVDGLLFLPRDGSIVTLASLTIRIQDEVSEDVIGTGVTLDHTVSGVELFGTQARAIQVPAFPYARWFMVQRPVRAGDRWLFTIGNVSGAPVTVAGLFIRFSEARPPRYSAGVNYRVPT